MTAPKKSTLNPIAWFFRAVFRVLIKGYQWLISPVLPGNCRFYPTCSSYALQALDAHGPLKGGWLGVKRILRCHPWNDGGYDPVPPGHGGHDHHHNHGADRSCGHTEHNV